MQVPLSDTYTVIQKKWKFSVTRCFFGHFNVKSRVTSVAWVKIGLEPLKGSPWGAKKRQKSVKQ
jgi:hypothetical protein